MPLPAFTPDLVASPPSIDFAASRAESEWRFHHPAVLGTRLNLLVHAVRPQDAGLAASRVRTEIGRLNALLNWRDPASELSRLNRSDSLQASPDLFAVLSAAERWRETTAGAYSGRLGRVSALWRQLDSEPDRQQASQMARAAEEAAVDLDPHTQMVLRPAAVQFDLDGLAKGYIVDRALAAALRGPGIRGALLDIGGDIRCGGEASDGGAWRVGLADPLSPFDNAPLNGFLALNDQAVATSGLGPRDRLVEGQWRSGTIDPRTGWPVAQRRSATVVAATAMDADALATAFTVLDDDDALRLVPSAGVRARLTRNEATRWVGDGPATWLPVQNRRAPPPTANQPGRWPQRWVAFVNFYAPPKQMRRQLAFRSPYVAIWVSDTENRLIRTLFLIGSIKDYHRENYIWWGLARSRAMELVTTRSFSTRGTGEYKVLWDGTDEAGKSVPAGRYILHVETNREEGSHTHRTLEIDATQARAYALETPMSEEAGQLALSFGRF